MSAAVATLRVMVASLIHLFGGVALNCYTLAWWSRLQHGRGRVVRMRGTHYGLRLELVILHYVADLGSWWGWRRRIEINWAGHA